MSESQESQGPLLEPEEIEKHMCRALRIQDLITRAEQIASRRHQGLASLLAELHNELGEAGQILGFDFSDPGGPALLSGGTPKG